MLYSSVSAVSDADVKTLLLTSKSCSYPFTSNGQLYFSCVQNTSSPCDAWCLSMNAQRLTCSKDDYGNITSDFSAYCNLQPLTEHCYHVGLDSTTFVDGSLFSTMKNSRSYTYLLEPNLRFSNRRRKEDSRKTVTYFFRFKSNYSNMLV